jgi:hypothetical protein
MRIGVARFMVAALVLAGAQSIAAQGNALGRPVAIDKLPTGSLYVLDALGAVHAVDFPGGKPAVTGTFTLPTGWAGSDIVSAQKSGSTVIFVAVNFGLIGQVCQFTSSGSLTKTWTLRNGIAGIAYDPASSTLFVASGRTAEIFRIGVADGSGPLFVAEATGSQRLGPLVYNAKDNSVLVGDVVYGNIVRVDIGARKSSILFRGLTSPQALKFSVDGSTLYVADAGAKKVMTLAMAQPGSAPKLFAAIPQFRSPSGLTLVGDQIAVSDDGANELFILSGNGSLQGALPALR